MKKFNINKYMYIQITDTGWQHLNDTLEKDYIIQCIDYSKIIIDGKIWHRLIVHEVFRLLPQELGKPLLYNPDVMFDDEDLT
jgi:hypothetical protein